MAETAQRSGGTRTPDSGQTPGVTGGPDPSLPSKSSSPAAASEGAGHAAPQDGAPAVSGDPEWLADHPFVRELRSYGRTFFTFALYPRHFAQEWLKEPSRFTNPLTFLALSAAAAGGASRLLDVFGDAPEKVSGWIHVGRSLGPYLYYVAVALLCHGLLYPLHRARRWTTAVAFALYAGGVSTLLIQGVIRAVATAMVFTGGAQRNGNAITLDGVWALLVLMLPLLGFYLSLAAALAGAHRLRAWTVAMVVLLPLIGTSFVSQWIPLPVAHLQVSFEDTGDGTRIGLVMTSGTL